MRMRTKTSESEDEDLKSSSSMDGLDPAAEGHIVFHPSNWAISRQDWSRTNLSRMQQRSASKTEDQPWEELAAQTRTRWAGKGGRGPRFADLLGIVDSDEMVAPHTKYPCLLRLGKPAVWAVLPVVERVGPTSTVLCRRSPPFPNWLVTFWFLRRQLEGTRAYFADPL